MAAPAQAFSLSLGEIVERLGGELRGDARVRVAQVGTLEQAGPQQISFLANPRYAAQLSSTRAGAVILSPKAADRYHGARILADNPYSYFARVAQLFNPRAVPAPGIHPTAVVNCDIPASVSVGALAWVGEDALIGEDVVIGPGSMVGAGAAIGEGSYLHASVTICAGCVVGKRAILHSGCVIGADGFGFAREHDASWVKIPQIGRVVLGDDVEIGANTTIDRGALDDTVIEDDVKIDNLVQIAHNCRIGAHTVIAGCAGIAGSTQIGKRCMIGGAAMINGHITIADDVTVSGTTFMPRSVGEAGVYTSAVHSLKHEDWLKNFSHLRHLDAQDEKIRALEKRMAELEKRT